MHWGAMMNDPPIEAADAQARELALDPARSILLQAPAGSGKTTVLTQRFLRLLAEVDEPEQILAITFTRKAAAEMLTRVVEALAWEAAPGKADQRRSHELAQRAIARSRERGWNLPQSPSRLRIQTIDGLCHRLAASLPVGSRAGSALQIDERPDDTYSVAARRTLQDAERDPALQPYAELLFTRLGNDWNRLERLLAEMLRSRNHWLRHLAADQFAQLRSRVETTLGELAAEALARVDSQVGADCLREGARLERVAAECLGQSARPRIDAAEPGLEARLAAWQRFAGMVLTAANSSKRALRRKVDKNQGFPPKSAGKAAMLELLAALAERPDAEDALLGVAATPSTRLDPDDVAALDALTPLLQFAAAQLGVEFAARGIVDYPAVSAAARQALVEDGYPTELALHQGARLRHVLVDEFQDTSIEQFELLENLVRGWDGDTQKSLFLVGDPMQSIYQFREAEVSLFGRAQQQGVGGVQLESLALACNFRSDASVIAWCNGSFPGVFPAAGYPREGSVPFSASVAARGSAGSLSAGVFWHRFAEPTPNDEAQQIVQIVQQARAQKPDASIAVLLTSRTHAAPIVEALWAAELAVDGVELVRLDEVSAVQDLLALARALLHAEDRIAWWALLRGPCCGLTLDELEHLAALAVDDSLVVAMRRHAAQADVRADTRQRLARVIAAMEAGEPHRAVRSFAQRVEAAWQMLGGPASCRSDGDRSNARRFLVALDSLPPNPLQLTSETIAGLVEGLYAASTPGPLAVQVMTVHKAKGLEFDCVILPSLHRGLQSDRESLLRWAEWPRPDADPALLIAPVGDDWSSQHAPLAEWLRALRRRRSECERARLAYVAATRARQQLHLLAADPPTRVNGSAPQPRAGSLLATLWPAVQPQWWQLPMATRGIAAPAIDPLPAGTEGQRWWRLPADWTLTLPSAVVAAPVQRVSRVLARERPDYQWVRPVGRYIGTVVHSELQRIAESRCLPNAAEASSRRARIVAQLRAAGVADTDMGWAAERVELALGRTAQDPRARWLLLEPHRDAASELALTGIVDGRLTQIVVDRTFVDAGGTRWLVDFKTSSHEGTGLEDFLANEAERYRPQLQRYARVSSGLGPEPVRAALYFPLLSRWVEVL